MILDLLVQTNPKGIVELESEAGTVRTIPFSGPAGGPLFQGIIEPCDEAETEKYAGSGLFHIFMCSMP